jgi:hypothetical protein
LIRIIVQYQLLFEGAGSNPVSVAFFFFSSFAPISHLAFLYFCRSNNSAHGEVVTRSLWVQEILGSIPGERLNFLADLRRDGEARVYLLLFASLPSKALWESGLIRQLKALVLWGMGSSPIEVTILFCFLLLSFAFFCSLLLGFASWPLPSALIATTSS